MYDRRKEKNPNWNGGKTIRQDGYVHVLVDEVHHRKNDRGYVMEHILIAEKALGKKITWKHRVHHLNGDRSDNRNCNLVLCEDETYHRLLHTRAKALKESGDANNRKCKFCKKYDSVDKIHLRYNKNGSPDSYHPSCASDKVLKRYHLQKGIRKRIEISRDTI